MASLKKLYRRLVSPKESGGDLNAARAWIKEGRWEEAFKLLCELKAQRTRSQDIDYLRAKYFKNRKNTVAAIEALKEELRYFPQNDKARESLNKLLEKTGARETYGDPEFAQVLEQIGLYTMSSSARLYSLFFNAKRVCCEDLPGNFVECGVAAGGSSALLGWVIKRYSKRPRTLFAFDSFSGMPKPTDKDKHKKTSAEDSGWGEGTCSAPEESLREICTKLGVVEGVKPVKGFFEETLPATKAEIGQIAFLHLDGDWYSSTWTGLENLYPQVVENGFVQLDDYGHWEGCRQATDDYQKAVGAKFAISVIDETGVSFTKRSTPVTADFGATGIKRVNLGCGANVHPEWINLDLDPRRPGVTFHDLREDLPFADGSVDAVYHSHVLEHLTKPHALQLIRECFRALRSGGILRIAVPDLENIARLYLQNLEAAWEGDGEATKRYDWLMLEFLDQMVRNVPGGEMRRYLQQDPIPAEEFVLSRMGNEARELINSLRKSKAQSEDGDLEPSPIAIAQFRKTGESHQWMYDRFSLRRLLAEVGFTDFKLCKAGESRIPDFAEHRLEVQISGETRKPDSIFVEAIKP